MAKKYNRKKTKNWEKIARILVVLIAIVIWWLWDDDLQELPESQPSTGTSDAVSSQFLDGEALPGEIGVDTAVPQFIDTDSPAEEASPAGQEQEPVSVDTVEQVPAYSGEPFCLINDNQPDFTAKEKKTKKVFETYAPVDELDRCGVAYANICKALMPTEERGDISSIRPSGWEGNNNEYSFVDGGRIYNRCHLIGFQLAGENANRQNLITGTRYMNVDGMLPFENMVADYVKENGGHVLYRVTPVFAGDNLVADGVELEAWSVEDGGEGVCFHVFCYNVQPGVEIDYATGENWLAK